MSICVETRRDDLVVELGETGWHTVADMVRHGYTPGNTVATLVDIWHYCDDRRWRLPAEIIDNAVAELESGEPWRVK